MSYAKQAAAPRNSERKRRGLTDSFWFHFLLVLGVCVVFYILFFSSLSVITRHGDDVKVPNVTGKDVRTATRLLEAQGFEVHIDSTYVPGKKALLVLDQLPDVGDVVKDGRTLFLTVNKSVPPETPMPNLVNLSFRSATLILKSNRLVLGDTTFRPDIARGAVLEQLINGQPIRAGQLIPQGSRIDLVIGDGLGNTELNVPDVIGMSWPEAVALLNGSGLLVTPVPDPGITDSTTAKVYKQTPNAISDIGVPTRIRQGDFIDIYIGQNPADSIMEQNRNEWKKHLLNNPTSKDSARR
jgi:beta-lactam-binding protein with PASTA domain